MSEEKACYCDSRQCDICTPPEPHYDWKGISQTMAADNARLCEIGLKADALAAAVKALIQDANRSLYPNLRKALEEYTIVRQGQ